MTPLRALVAAVAVTACSTGSPAGSPSDEVAAPALTTDADRYVLERTAIGWEVEIPFIYVNPTRGSVFVLTCLGPRPPILEKWVGGRWVTAWDPTVPACLGPVLRLPPGERYSAVLHVFAGFPSNNFHPKLDVEEPEGVYRLVWEVLSSYDPDRHPFGPPLPEHQRVSNTFRLTEGD